MRRQQPSCGEIRGLPAAPSGAYAGGDVLESLVSDIVRVIENELVQNRYPIAQKARAWFQSQHEALILLGMRIGRTARALWKPEYAFGIFFELGVLATERALSDLAKQYSSEWVSIQHWASAYERLVHVLGVSVTAALGLGGALGRLIIDNDEGDEDSGPAEDVIDVGEDESTEDGVDEPAPYGALQGEKIHDESGDEEQEVDNEDANADVADTAQSEEDEGNDEEEKGRNEEWDDANESEDAPDAEDDDSEDDTSGEGIATGNGSEDAAYEDENNRDEDKEKGDGEDEWDENE